jgi:hypothetical protein
MGKKHNHSLLDSPKYRRWVKERDRALEQLFQTSQRKSADLLRRFMREVLYAAKGLHPHLENPSARAIDRFEYHTRALGHQLAKDLTGGLFALLRNAYVLAKASEFEIMAQHRVGGRESVNKISAQDADAMIVKNSMAGGDRHKRVQHYVDRLVRKIVSQATASTLSNEPVDAATFMQDISAAFPRGRVVKRPKRVLSPRLMEAENEGDGYDVAIDDIDEEVWNTLLDAYKEEFIPQWRGPTDTYDPFGFGLDELPTPDDKYTLYAWEFERDQANEFVRSVRDGQVAAANDIGVTDFVWISILDNKVDACCQWRDGLLTSEIEKQLKDHADEDADCNLDASDQTVPPIHFNCRCSIAPATDDIPNKPDDGANEFYDWLTEE